MRARKSHFNRNMRHVIDNNIGIFFEILNETEDDLEKYFLKEKEEYRRKLFLFWNLVGVYEAVIMPTDEPLFTDFYEAFYSGVDFLEYEIEKSYNIVGREFYSVMLKVKIGDKLIKKESALRSYHLDLEVFRVNGQKQSPEITKRYQEKYLTRKPNGDRTASMTYTVGGFLGIRR